MYNLFELLRGCLACPGYVNKAQKGDIDRLPGGGGAKQRRLQVALNIHASIDEARRALRGEALVLTVVKLPREFSSIQIT